MDVRQVLQRLRAPGRRSVLRHAAVVGVLALAGALFATSARTAQGSDLRAEATDLPGLVAEEQQLVARRDEQVAALRQEVEALTASVQDPAVRELQTTGDALEPAAGTVAVTGPGLTLTLDDAPVGRPQAEGTATESLIVHQEDLQAVVNALWAGGAEAMTLMGQRIISTSAVRCVGNTLKLQGRVYSPPYTVEAVGDPDALRAALDASEPVQLYRDDVQRVGLGWDLDTDADLRVPGWEGSLELDHARALEPAGAVRR